MLMIINQLFCNLITKVLKYLVKYILLIPLNLIEINLLVHVQ